MSDDEILDDEMLDDEMLDDEMLDDEILDDEILDDEMFGRNANLWLCICEANLLDQNRWMKTR